MLFFNMYDLDSIDASFFADSTHLQKKGAEIFTQKLLDRMEKEGVFQKVNGKISYNE